MLENPRAARAIGSYERRFQSIDRVDLPVIEDFGLKPLRLTQNDDLQDLIGERYERCFTAVTSNLALSDGGEPDQRH